MAGVTDTHVGGVERLLLRGREDRFVHAAVGTAKGTVERQTARDKEGGWKGGEIDQSEGGAENRPRWRGGGM